MSLRCEQSKCVKEKNINFAILVSTAHAFLLINFMNGLIIKCVLMFKKQQYCISTGLNDMYILIFVTMGDCMTRSIRPKSCWLPKQQCRNIDSQDKYSWNGKEKSAYCQPLPRCVGWSMDYYGRFCMGTENWWTVKWKHNSIFTVTLCQKAFD